MRKVALNWEDVACLGTQLLDGRSTILVRNRSGLFPRLAVDGRGRKLAAADGVTTGPARAEVDPSC
jgi:hypothetical protein